MDFKLIGQIIHITQHGNHKLKYIENSQPLLVYVISGEKLVELNGETLSVKAGQIIAIPANTILNMTNLSINNTPYQAICFSWYDELLNQFASSNKQIIPKPLKKIKVETDLRDNFINRLSQIESELINNSVNDSGINLMLVKHLFLELLIRLSSIGIVFKANNNTSISYQIRQMISQQPDKKWKLRVIADQFAMSESTLRRYLAREGQNLSQIILDVRLNYGLVLLQTTQKSILTIAQSAGYDSGSRFTHYFKKRFGISPKMLRSE